MANNFNERDMYDNSYRVLRRRYPSYEGWVITPQEHHGTYIPDFVVEKTWGNRYFKVVVEVKKCRITQNDVNQLNSYVRNLAGTNVSIREKIFIVASGADTSHVPNDINVIYLRDFLCN